MVCFLDNMVSGLYDDYEVCNFFLDKGNVIFSFWEDSCECWFFDKYKYKYDGKFDCIGKVCFIEFLSRL